MDDKEIVSYLTEQVKNSIHSHNFDKWKDLRVGLAVDDPSRPFDGIILRGEINDLNSFYSISLRKGYRDNDPGVEIAKKFTKTDLDWDFENTLLSLIHSPEVNRFIRVNGYDFSFDEVAKSLGVQDVIGPEPVQVELCQRVDSGVLVAKSSFFDHDDYPGIDLELQLPPEKGSMPIMISRTEQPRPEGESHSLRTFGFSRENEYFMYFDSDLRPDAQVDEDLKAPALTVSGDLYCPVEVFAENPYIEYKGYSAPSLKESLESKIQSAASRSADGQPSGEEHQNEHFR